MKTNKIIRHTRKNYVNIQTDLQHVWRSTQRINLQSQTGRSVPDTGYTNINITISLQHFSSAKLASSSNINIRHSINSYPSSDNTEPKNTENYSRPNRLAGTYSCPLQLSAEPYRDGESQPNPISRRRECVKYRNRILKQGNTKTNL